MKRLALTVTVFAACGGAPEAPLFGSGDAAAPDAAPTVDAGSPPWWRPTPDAPIHWHWQLQDDFVYPRDVLPNKHVFDIDGESATQDTVAKLHALAPDVKVICYFDAGAYESWRSDAKSFPKSVIGKPDQGWPNTWWLDIRRLDALMPILTNRAQTWCKDKGFDAVEPDETEVYLNDSGFPITQADAIAFDEAIAAMVHGLGLSVGLKGNNGLVKELEPYFDWALTEQCWEARECQPFRDVFIKANKAVLDVEFNVDPDCPTSNAWHINSSRRDLDIAGPKDPAYRYAPCVPDAKDTW